VSADAGLDQAVDQDLVRDLARRIIEQAAPEELPLLRSTSERYFADPEKALGKRRREQEVLGFGAEAVVALLSPIVLAVVTDVLKDLAADVARAAGTRSIATIRASLRRLLRLGPAAPETASPEIAPITPEQLALVRRSAFDRALALDLSEARATLLADALIGSLSPPDRSD
jgi:hypothetical protein